MKRLEGKVSIVTGGGSGIGRGISRLFAAEGSKVVVAEIVPKTGEETVRMIKASGAEAIFVETDVSKAVEVDRMVKCAVDTFGALHVLCNNAGIFSVEPPLISDLLEETWDQAITVNLKGVYLCCKYAILEMIKAGGGSIVNISSVAGLIKSPNYAYAASKGGIISLTRSLAMQCADYNIRANVICPGSIDTPGRSASINSRSYKGDLGTRLIRKLGTPEDIAYAAVYLASEEASYVTGAVFVIDGGSLRG